ncbi:preprotein translocase subunit SecG [Candidatus Curtissbacteria bacterium RIFCSPLOWO2_01_FULL_41_18]|uniref:Protein-export membrane protein SecG n=1 Tax=Candidatus Curtissbacteria bacterium RIFCSPLOWO2_01_FULL_41_18 TaxID=1797727 RepID=A0A1F5HM14_9BACT|nr:MAG: preprotein translocase subunit SecG [Candidatus Curtissbacteria bacterium RIFCSPLOWO2_01_FULL_41_18]
MKNILLVLQIIVSVLLILVILLQSKGTGLGTVFGGSGSIYRSKRGIEKLFIYLTILLALSFFLISVLQVIIY